MTDLKSGSVSLVLGSGGARGLTHIGVIDALTERGYRIESISGCSMGALVGGVFALGKLDEYRDWVCALQQVDLFKLMDFAFGSAALLRGERIISVLRDMLGDTKIEELSISFTAVAADLNSGKELWIEKGMLFDAIRASIGIPTVFPPVEMHSRLLVDGGLLNPVPIAPTMRDTTDHTVAVDLGGSPQSGIELPENPTDDNEKSGIRQKIRDMIDALVEKVGREDDEDDQPNMLEIVNRSFDIMQGALTRLRMGGYEPDLVIQIPRNVCRMWEFHRAKGLIEFGYQRTLEALDRHQETG